MLVTILATAFLAQAPAAKPALPPAAASVRRQEELRQTAARRKAATARKQARRATRAVLDYQERRAQEAYVARMAPIWAKQQTEAARLALEQQRANALSAVADAAQKEAAIDLGRLRLEQRQAGIPFVPTPGGMQPYPYAAGATP